MSLELNELNRMVGRLQSSVETLTATWQRQDSEASEGRRRLHAKIDEMKSQQEAMAATVEQQTAEIAELKPAIKRFEAERLREQGARSLAKLIWGGVLAFATGLGYLAHELLIFFWPPKGH